MVQSWLEQSVHTLFRVARVRVLERLRAVAIDLVSLEYPFAVGQDDGCHGRYEKSRRRPQIT